jgi:hypothetical protein
MMVPHTAGVTRFVLPLRGESLAAWSNFMCGTFSAEADLQKQGSSFLHAYRNTARTLCQSDGPFRSPSCFDGDG